MTYTYRSGRLLWSIRPDPSEPGRWRLYANEEYLGAYISPEQAADAVYTQTTSHHGWDMRPPVTEPADLSEWTRHR